MFKERFLELLEQLFLVVTSTRFWFITTGALFFYLKSTGKMTPELADGLMIILFGSPAIGTIDKFGQYISSSK